MKKKFLYYSVLIILIVFFLQFLQGFAIGLLGFDGHYQKACFVNDKGKKVVLFGIMHIEHKEYYQSLMHEFDSLNKADYVLFYEQMKIGGACAELQKKKIDKLLNQYSIERYNKIAFFLDLEAHTNKILKERFDNKKNVDINACEYIDLYESLLGSTIDDNHEKNITIEDSIIYSIREEMIVDNVLESDHQNITLLYGVGHFENLKKQLKKKGYDKL